MDAREKGALSRNRPLFDMTFQEIGIFCLDDQVVRLHIGCERDIGSDLDDARFEAREGELSKLVLGEDVTNTAPMLDPAIRQAVRGKGIELAAKIKVPAWDDAGVRNADNHICFDWMFNSQTLSSFPDSKGTGSNAGR